MADMTQFATFFDNGLAVGIIVILFAVLFYYIKASIQTNKEFQKQIQSKDAQLIEQINKFNDTINQVNQVCLNDIDKLNETTHRLEDKIDDIQKTTQKIESKIDNIKNNRQNNAYKQ